MSFYIWFPIFIFAIIYFIIIYSSIKSDKIKKKEAEKAEKKRIDNIQLIKNLFKNGEIISYNKNGISFIISKENGWSMDIGEKLFIKDSAIINIDDIY